MSIGGGHFLVAGHRNYFFTTSCEDDILPFFLRFSSPNAESYIKKTLPGD
jgi:hypothetical protein